MNADSRSSAREARALVEAPAAVCTECPVCGSEECLMLEELGQYCATMTAASLAKKASPAKKEEEAAKRA
jgi:hypothetical protein